MAWSTTEEASLFLNLLTSTPVAENMRSDGTAFDVQVSVVKDTASTSFKSDINFSFHITIHHLNPGFYCIS